jgi:hypothetical protein
MTINPARVFVTQENPKINITPALKYGKIEVLLAPGEEIVLGASYCVNRMDALLRDFSDADYLLPVGNPVAIAIAAALAARYNRGRFNVLKWDNRQHVYYPITVELPK